MSYGQSLEDMLAELEAPTGGKRGGGSSSGSKDDSVEDFDGFMKKLEFGSQPATQAAQPSKPASTQPAARPVVQSQPVQNKQPVQQQQNRNVSNDLGGGRLPGMGGGGGNQSAGGSSVGEKLLQTEGFVRHNNKGKFVNYRNGKATDFRIKGTTSSKVGLLHVITLRALDDYGALTQITEVKPTDFIAVILTHRETKKDIQPWFKDNNDGTYDLAFYNDFGGTVRMEIKLCGNPMFDLDIQVDEAGDSLWVALGEAQIQPNHPYRIDIVTSDGSRPEGVAPFEVQTMGDVSDLKLVNNGDGTYYCECVPHSDGHITVQICLHGEPIKNSPLTVQVGEKQKYTARQTAVPAPRPQQPQQQQRPVAQQPARTQQQQYPTGLDDILDSYTANSQHTHQSNNVEVTTDDLNALLDELGGY